MNKIKQSNLSAQSRAESEGEAAWAGKESESFCARDVCRDQEPTLGAPLQLKYPFGRVFDFDEEE